MIEYRSVELQTAKIHFDIPSGFFEPADVRGKDIIVPGRTGRVYFARVKDSRSVELQGYVMGIGATPQERSEDWHASTQALMAVMDYSLAAGALVASEGYLGLPAGDIATLQARCVNAIPGPVLNCMSFQRWSFELECVASPPEWDIESS